MFGMSFDEEKIWHRKIAMAILWQSPMIYVLLRYVVPAPWGKTISYKFGPLLPARISWFVFESPNLIWCIVCCSAAAWKIPTINAILLSLFFLHYVRRSIFYPICMSSNTTKIPCTVVLAAFTFCFFNGYLQAQGLCQFRKFPKQWQWHPQFIVGILLFFIGAWWNYSADTTLQKLRRSSSHSSKQPPSYKIPRGGMFEYVSTPHYFGEIVQWIGFTLACKGSLESVAFVIYTAANLIPRGIAHHEWYQQRFPTQYPKQRRAVVPFLW